MWDIAGVAFIYRCLLWNTPSQRTLALALRWLHITNNWLLNPKTCIQDRLTINILWCLPHVFNDSEALDVDREKCVGFFFFFYSQKFKMCKDLWKFQTTFFSMLWTLTFVLHSHAWICPDGSIANLGSCEFSKSRNCLQWIWAWVMLYILKSSKELLVILECCYQKQKATFFLTK